MEKSVSEGTKIQYQELHTQFREAIALYLKGSTMGLAVLGVSIGFLLKVPLSPPNTQLLCSCVIIVMLLWYVASLFSLRLYRSLTRSICDLSESLSIKYEEKNYSIFRVVILAGMGAAFPITLVLFYLLFFPLSLNVSTIITP